MIFLTTGLLDNVAVGSNSLRGIANTFSNCVAIGEHNFFGANGNGTDNSVWIIIIVII